MTIYIGADHRGFALKEKLKPFVQSLGHEIFDCGNAVEDPADDYPVFASTVAEKVSADPKNARGVVLCGSGTGVDIVANKFTGVRSVLALHIGQVRAARHDDDVNILAIAADFTDLETAKEYVRIFLETSFSSEERFARRIEEVEDIEKQKKHTRE